MLSVQKMVVPVCPQLGKPCPDMRIMCTKCKEAKRRAGKEEIA
jgi:hypothetical protein